LKIYLATEGDTLRTICQVYKTRLEELFSLNPHIPSADQDIAGILVNLPEKSHYSTNKTTIPDCQEVPIYREQWVPLTSLEDMEQTDYDVLIVGTGAGGGAALWRLSEQWGTNGKRIGIIEAGDLLLQTNAQNIATMTPDRLIKYFHSVGISPPQYHSPQVYALGGRTLFWWTISPRMHVSEIARWPLTIKEMDFYYKIAEKVMNVTQSFTKGSSLTQTLLKRLQENGFPEAMDEPLSVDLGSTKYGVVNSNPFFSSLIFIAKSMNRPFDLAVKARAVQVLAEKNKVVGVKVMSLNKKAYFLKAKNVVLSASTLGTPRILLNSGIQGRAIGHYLSNHSRLVAKGKIYRSEFPEKLGPLRILVPGTKNRPYQYSILGPLDYEWVQFQEEPLRAEWEIEFLATGRVESCFENKVLLDPIRRDEYGIPEIQVDFSFSTQDEIVIQQMERTLKQVSSAIGTPLTSICLAPPGLEAHEVGTCRMGDDPLTSAANRFGQIHDIHGLYVADNSVIPTSGTANPTLTTVALAIRTADYIIHQLNNR
jgi:choline dehydrogenase-like flavoprotein